MSIGLDFVRDWQWCLGLWILAGFAAVFACNLVNTLSDKTRTTTSAEDIKLFLAGPIWWTALLGGLAAAGLMLVSVAVLGLLALIFRPFRRR